MAEGALEGVLGLGRRRGRGGDVVLLREMESFR